MKLTELNISHLEFLLYWCLALIASVATLVTVFVSKNKGLRRFVIFNLSNFLISTAFLYFIVKAFGPNYGLLLKKSSSWLSFTGPNILIYLLFSDFLFYLYHRMTHAIPLLWLSHYSHHTATHMHISVIARDSILTHVFTFPFALIGASLGLSPSWVYICIRIIVLYQSLLHFNATKDIPYLKYFLVTPYNHIMHHSINFTGSGHNFGGLLCIWDRAFNTFVDSPRYLHHYGVPGLVNPDRYFNIHFSPLLRLFKKCFSNKSLRPIFIFENLNYKIWQKASVAYGICLILVLHLITRVI